MMAKHNGENPMTTAGHIRVKAICLFRHGQEILVFKGYDPVKQAFYYRPLGGTTEFGEYTQATLVREIQEELGTTITNLTLVTVCENIFTYNGQPGHEIMFVYNAEFTDPRFYQQRTHTVIESNGEEIEALWVALDAFGPHKRQLVPEALNTYLGIPT
jgi:8-oxo-dGTP pyrophosphatase MutT (NUDIX family)